MVAITKFLFLAATVTAAILRRDVTDTCNAIDNIRPATGQLQIAVTAFTVLTGAAALHAAFLGVVSGGDAATTALEAAGSCSVDDIATINVHIQLQLPIVVAAVGELAGKVAISGLARAQICSDLKALLACGLRFLATLAAAAPPDSQSLVQGLQIKISDAFNPVIAVYS